MDANFWKIKDGSGTLKTFAAWKVSAQQPITRILSSLDVDTLSFVVEMAVDDTPPFDPDEQLSFYRNGSLWFTGIVTKRALTATGNREAIAYEVSGGWYWLEQLPFEEDWNIADDPTNPASTLSPVKKTRVNLFQKLDGTKLLTTEQITDAINFCISKGAPIAIGTISLPDVRPTISQVVDQSCAEVIRACLRWHPDAVAWFDYSTLVPTLNIKQRSACVSVDRAFDNSPSATIQITPRDDLLVTGVRIVYEITNSIDEVSWTQHTLDEAGSPDAFKAVKVTIQLGGASETWQRQQLSAVAWFPALYTFWAAKFPALALATAPSGVGTFTVQNAKVDGGPTLTALDSINEVSDGAIPHWLNSTTTEVIVTADLSYSLKNPTTGAEEIKIAQPFSYKLKKTSLFAGLNQTFSRLSSATAAEPIPTGVAQAYYDATSVLHYEGQWNLVEDEVSSAIGIGNKLNLTGGPAEWEAMDALIQKVSEDLVTGSTVLTFGPPAHLSVQDFVALLKVQRERSPSWRLQERIDGKAYGNKAQVDGATKFPDSKPDQPTVAGKAVILAEKPADNPSKIKLTTADIVAAVQALTDKDIKLRAVRVCNDEDPGADNWWMQVLGSAPYQV